MVRQKLEKDKVLSLSLCLSSSHSDSAIISDSPNLSNCVYPPIHLSVHVCTRSINYVSSPFGGLVPYYAFGTYVLLGKDKINKLENQWTNNYGSCVKMKKKNQSVMLKQWLTEEIYSGSWEKRELQADGRMKKHWWRDELPRYGQCWKKKGGLVRHPESSNSRKVVIKGQRGEMVLPEPSETCSYGMGVTWQDPWIWGMHPWPEQWSKVERKEIRNNLNLSLLFLLPICC